MSINLDVKVVKVGFWHMPKTFYALLFIEFFERFAFYGLQSVAVIYFVQKFLLDEANASKLFSSFSALVYALLIVGGYIGDKIIGLRRTYLLGILTFIIGYALLSLATSLNLLYYAMGVILIANVFFKTNANNYVSRCFEKNDPRMDSAFTYFYMSINVGSFVGILLIPIIAQVTTYNVALSFCAIGMFIALIAYFIFRKRLILSDNQIGKSDKNKFFILLSLFIFGLVFAYIISILLSNLELCKAILFIASIVILCIYLWLCLHVTRHESKAMLLALVLLLQAIIFWILYMQTATSMTLFAYHNVNLKFWGYELPAGVTQSFNPFFIMLFSPILANIYIYLYKRNLILTIPTKFSLGIFFTSWCFIILGFASSFLYSTLNQISVIWLFIAYGFYSLGELLVSALGPSMMAKLLPKRFGGFAQGVWYLTSAIGMQIGGQISAHVATTYASNNSLQSLQAYNQLFYLMGIIVIVISIVFFIILKPLNKILFAIND